MVSIKYAVYLRLGGYEYGIYIKIRYGRIGRGILPFNRHH
jgi:hypothetical protein